jgi:hypothetical protein
MTSVVLENAAGNCATVTTSRDGHSRPNLFTVYIRGTGLDKPGAEKERERDIDVSYVFQDFLKGFSVRLRNATYRSEDGRDIDENR